LINLRADKGKRALIDRAAEAVGKNRSEVYARGGLQSGHRSSLGSSIFSV